MPEFLLHLLLHYKNWEIKALIVVGFCPKALGCERRPFSTGSIDILTVSRNKVRGGVWGSKGNQSPRCWQLWCGTNLATFAISEAVPHGQPHVTEHMVAILPGKQNSFPHCLGVRWEVVPGAPRAARVLGAGSFGLGEILPRS